MAVGPGSRITICRREIGYISRGPGNRRDRVGNTNSKFSDEGAVCSR